MRTTHRLNLLVALAGLLVLGWVGACLDDPGAPDLPPPPPLPPPPAGLVVSDPAAPAAVSVGGAGAASTAAVVEDSVVYVSLAPGTEPSGVTATVRSFPSGGTMTAAVENGGFDPVAVSATVGDTVEVVVRDASSVVVLDARLVVALVLSPTIVRTDPPPRKRDVPLNSVMVVVFSEPIDAATLSSATMYVRTGETTVAGRLEFRDAEQLTAAFVPDASLSPGADYVLAVTQGIRDLDGDSLEDSVAVEFRTVEPQLVFTVQPTNMGAGLAITPHVQVAARDALGNVITDYADDVSVVIGTNAVGGSLTGTTTVAAVAGVATFGDLRIDVPGSGYTLVATATGLGADTSAYFDITSAESPTGLISFTSRGAAGSSEIFVMRVDGSGVRQLTDDAAQDEAATWSPDGTMLAFLSDRDRPNTGNMDVYVMKADGSGVTRLTTVGNAVLPAWSRSGTRIAFHTYPEFGIYVMNTDGSDLRPVTNEPGVWNAQPAWSPDGAKLTFSSDRDGNREIYVMNADGSGVTRLTNDPGNDEFPAWSPDGTKIAFDSFRDGNTEIYVMNVDGSGITKLTDHPSEDGNASWSPDGTRIAFISLRAGAPYQVFIMNADGSGVTQVTSYPTGAYQPEWSPVSFLPVASVTVTPESATVAIQEKVQLSATLRDANGGVLGGRPVVWTSSDLSVAVVDSNGLVTGVGVGSAHVIATSEGVSDTATIRVASPLSLVGAVVTWTDVSGVGAWGVVNEPIEFYVAATDAQGNGVSDVTLDWAVTAGGGSVAPVRNSTTDSICCTTFPQPVARATHTLGPGEGLHAVTVTANSIPGTPQATFSTRVVHGLVALDQFNGFSPASVTVPVGTTVAWIWNDGCCPAEHDVVFEDEPTEPVSSPRNTDPAFHTRIFSVPGTYRYRCTNHSSDFTQGEVGAVTVVGPATRLGFTVQPTNSSAGAVITPAVEVTARDAFGNVATGFTGNVSVAIGTNPAGGKLSGTATITAVAGAATFADLRVDRPGSGYTLIATATNLDTATSTGFDIAAPPTGRIAFTGPGGIDVMNADGSALTTLADGWAPAWSPDGSKIVFAIGGGQYSCGGLYVMNADGSNITPLGCGDVNLPYPNALGGWPLFPAWSPDGSSISFAFDLQWHDGQFVRYNAIIRAFGLDGSGVRDITVPPADMWDWWHSWSPNGAKIAFLRQDGLGYALYSVNPDGSGLTKLSDGGSGPSWSPDGTKIAFYSNPGTCDQGGYGRDCGLFIMNADGSGVTQLLADTTDVNHPVWSPDGTKIAFARWVDDVSEYEIYVMNADGSGLSRLTNRPGWDWYPKWSPASMPTLAPTTSRR